MAWTILVVEDDKSVARFLGDVLEREGYKVLFESDGEWALRTAQSKPVDLMLLDVLLPKLVGFDVVDRLRQTEKGKTLPVVMISGVYRAAAHKDALMQKLGIIDYLDKPVDLDRLLDAVRRGLGQPAAQSVRRAPGLTSIAPDVRAIDEADPMAKLPGLPIPRLGEVSDVPFARLVGQLYAARANGALMLRRGQVKKIVYFRYGIPVFVKSNLISECLGQVMVRERLLSESQCEISVEKLKKERRKQGVILVELGFISPHNLAFALERQLELKLLDLFSWLDGKYLFSEKDDYEGPTVALALSPAELVYEGVRRTMSTERVKKELEKVADRAVLAANDPTLRYQALELDPGAGPLLALIDGRRRLRGLLEHPAGSTAEAVVLLYALACTSLLKLRDVPARERSEEVIAVGDADVEALRTGELPTDAVSAAPELTLARAKARAARSALEAKSGILAAAPLPPPPPPPSDLSSDLQVPKTGVAPPPAPPFEDRPSEPGPSPDLSSAVREQARARIEASFAERMSARPDGAAASAALPAAARLDLGAEQQRLAAELEKSAERLRKKNHYERLGVHRLATAEEIETAYEALAQTHDPEHVVPGGHPRALRQIADEIFLLYTRARDALLNPVERATYERTIGGLADGERVAPLFRAERLFRQGQAAEDAGDWAGASAALESAVEADPEEGRYLAHLAFCRYSARPDDLIVVDRALTDLARAAEVSPRCEDAHFFAGLILAKLGRREEATEKLRRALEINPDSVRAAPALRGLAPPVEKRGLFRRGTG
ncbi:MAG: response regulator [Deltaproteobacteria bacterium]|nr:response regulator [Deltaproteobacteria bacterium]